MTDETTKQRLLKTPQLAKWNFTEDDDLSCKLTDQLRQRTIKMDAYLDAMCEIYHRPGGGSHVGTIIINSLGDGCPGLTERFMFGRF